MANAATTLTKIKKLFQSAQNDPATSNYYADDIQLYIQFLTLWSTPKEPQRFSDADQASIETYLTALEQKLLPEYQDNLANFDPDQNLQSADLLHLTPKDNIANRNDYVQIVQFINNQITPNAVIDPVASIAEPVTHLIDRNELPANAQKLSWVELALLINAIAYQHWFEHKA